MEKQPATQAIGSVDRLAPYARFFPALLLLVCLGCYLPGLLRLPAVDRTEVIFAETTRDLVETGDWINPNYRGTVHQFRPIGTFWAQGLSHVVAGAAHARDIRVYRIPGALAVTASVLVLYGLTAPLVGAVCAFIAALLLAVAPLTVLLSQLAIADGLALLPAMAAMLALLRIYTAEPGADTRRLALVFWAAVGGGMLVNALHTPILASVTLLALYLFDRDLSWLKRLHAGVGVILALLLAAPWIAVRIHQDGVPFAGMSVGKLLGALGGAQDMKLRAFPGTFLLAALLGFLPGTALLLPALMRLWDERQSERLARFLLAWIAGYLVYLEVLSSKPGTYTVQVMFPAMALAVGLLAGRHANASAPPGWHALAWPPLAGLFALVLFALPYAAMREVPPLWVLPLALLTALLFAWSAAFGRRGALQAWAVCGAAALAIFAVSLTAGILPSIDRIWPARQITRALEGCAPGPIAVTGFREPSSYFVLGNDEGLLAPDALRARMQARQPLYIGTEVRSDQQGAAAAQIGSPPPIACVQAFNTMRGCPLFFTMQATGDTQACKSLANFPCTSEFKANAQAARSATGCD